MFTVFVNIFIINPRVLGVGCNVNGCYIGCLMYADDLILLSATVNGLQAMLNCCFSTSTELRLQFNCAKSTCTAIGPGAANSISDYAVGFEFYFVFIYLPTDEEDPFLSLSKTHRAAPRPTFNLHKLFG